MKQQSFEKRFNDDWLMIEQELLLSKKKLSANFPKHYRALCHHLAIAKERRYSPYLITRLNHLVISSHQRLYQYKSSNKYQWLQFLVVGFPQTLRKNWRYVAVASLLFLFPLFVMGIACYFNDELIYSLMNPIDVQNFEKSYNPNNETLGRERGSDTDLMMFGHYINNNIGIGFRTFASGILFGLGSFFFLIYNGIAIGGVAGHLTQIGYSSTFYPFVVGHGPFELTAIVFSGAAGLKLGYALIDPGPSRRIDAVRTAGREAIKIVYGCALMLLIAAFIEAFWSSSKEIIPSIKYMVGFAFALLLIIYCCLSGKHNGS